MTNGLIYSTETDSQTQTIDLWLVAKEEKRHEGDGLRVCDYQMQTSVYRINKQQGPTVQHREIYSISCDKPEWKKYEKECIYIYKFLCCTEETNITL